MRNATAPDFCRSERILATVPIRLVVVSDDYSIEREASTVDLSPRGVRVRTPLALLPGDTIGIIPIGESRRPIPARVVWTQRARTDQWSLAGLEFLEPMRA
jgi:PilZ domain-containing protein